MNKALVYLGYILCSKLMPDISLFLSIDHWYYIVSINWSLILHCFYQFITDITLFLSIYHWYYIVSINWSLILHCFYQLITDITLFLSIDHWYYIVSINLSLILHCFYQFITDITSFICSFLLNNMDNYKMRRLKCYFIDNPGTHFLTYYDFWYYIFSYFKYDTMFKPMLIIVLFRCRWRQRLSTVTMCSSSSWRLPSTFGVARYVYIWCGKVCLHLMWEGMFTFGVGKVCLPLVWQGMFTFGVVRYVYIWCGKVCLHLVWQGMFTFGVARYVYIWCGKVCLHLGWEGMFTFGVARYVYIWCGKVCLHLVWEGMLTFGVAREWSLCGPLPKMVNKVLIGCMSRSWGQKVQFSKKNIVRNYKAIFM